MGALMHINDARPSVYMMACCCCACVSDDDDDEQQAIRFLSPLVRFGLNRSLARSLGRSQMGHP